MLDRLEGTRATKLASVRGQLQRNELRGLITAEVAAMDLEGAPYDDLPPLSDEEYEELMLLLQDELTVEREAELQYEEMERFEQEQLEATIRCHSQHLGAPDDDFMDMEPEEKDVVICPLCGGETLFCSVNGAECAKCGVVASGVTPVALQERMESVVAGHVCPARKNLFAEREDDEAFSWSRGPERRGIVCKCDACGSESPIK